MSWRGTALLVLLALLAVGWFFFSAPSRTRSASDSLLDINPAKADRIVIWESGGIVQLVRSNGIWYVKGAVKDRADQHLVAALLHAATAITPLDMLGPGDLKGGVSPESLGLRNPKRSLTVDAGPNHTLWLGIEGAAKGRLYAKLDSGKEVYLISSDIVPLAFRPVQEFRDPLLTALDAGRLAEVSLSAENNLTNLLLRKDPHGWSLVNPLAARGDDQAVTSWLHGLTAAPVRRWMPGDTVPSSCGMDSPTTVVTLRREGSDQPLSITVGSRVQDSPGSYYVRCSDRPGICVVEGIDSFLAATPQTLRSHRLPPVDYDTVDRMEWTGGGDGTTSLLLRRQSSGDDWEIAQPAEAAGTVVPGDTVRTWFDSLERLTARGFEPATPEHLQPRGFDRADHLRLIAHLSENTAEEKAGEMVLADYSFGAASGGTFALRVGEATDLAVFPESALGLLQETPVGWMGPATSPTAASTPGP